MDCDKPQAAGLELTDGEFTERDQSAIFDRLRAAGVDAADCVPDPMRFDGESDRSCSLFFRGASLCLTLLEPGDDGNETEQRVFCVERFARVVIETTLCETYQTWEAAVDRIGGLLLPENHPI